MATLKISDFTPEIQAKIPDYIARGVEGVFDGGRYEQFHVDNARTAVNWNYTKCEYKNPVVVVTENPYEQQVVFHLIKNNKKLIALIQEAFDNDKIIKPEFYELLLQLIEKGNWGKVEYAQLYLFTLNVYSDCYYQWYKFIKDEFHLPLTIEKDFEECFTLQHRSGVYSAIFTEICCIVSKYPKKVYRDNAFRLHNTDGLAVDWGYLHENTKFDCYYVNGINVPKKWVIDKDKLTQEDFLSEKNAEKRRCLSTILGGAKLIALLNMDVIDEDTDAEGYPMKLYRTKEVDDITKEHIYLLGVVCPSTKREYFLGVPGSKNVWEAKKWTFNNQDIYIRHGDVGIIHENLKFDKTMES